MRVMKMFEGVYGSAGRALQDSTSVTYDSAPIQIKQIDEADLQQYRDDPAFDYVVEELERTWSDDFTAWLSDLLYRFFENLFGVEKAGGFLRVFLEVLPYLLLGVLIFLLIKFFLKVNANALLRRRKEKASVALSEEERLIRNEDLKQLIKNALADNNYRLAVRYYYLYVLKLLSEKEHIVWELQKTNRDYLGEIKSTDIRLPFGNITRLYEHIWYGDFPMDAPKYQKAERLFSSLEKTLADHG